MKVEPQLVLLLFAYILVNIYYTYIIINYSKQFERVAKEQEFKNLLMGTPEYKNQNIDKKFIKFFSKINKHYLSDEDIEQMYFDSLEGKELKANISVDERKYLYVLTCLMLVVNGLFTFKIIQNEDLNSYIKIILVFIQLLFLYNLYLVIKNLSDDNQMISLELLRKIIYFVWICLIIFIMNTFNMFDNKNFKNIVKIFNKKIETKSASNNIENNNDKENNTKIENNNDKVNINSNSKDNTSNKNVDKILKDNEKFLSNVSESLKK
jgi:hypothetical protein